MSEQLELQAVAPEAEFSAAFLAEVAELETMLVDGPMKAREITAVRPEWNERHIRAIAEASRAIVSFPGSPGYRLLAQCTAEDLYRAEAAFGAQIAAMQEKRIRLRNLAGLSAAMEKVATPAEVEGSR